MCTCWLQYEDFTLSTIQAGASHQNPRFNYKKKKTYLQLIIIVEFQLHKLIHLLIYQLLHRTQENNIVRKADPYFNFCYPQITGWNPKYVGVCFSRNPKDTGLR